MGDGMIIAHLPLDADRCRDLVTAAILHNRLPFVLSPFEVELLWDLNERALRSEPATCTADEWRIVEDCLADLRAALAGYRVVADGMSICLVEVVPP